VGVNGSVEFLIAAISSAEAGRIDIRGRKPGLELSSCWKLAPHPGHLWVDVEYVRALLMLLYFILVIGNLELHTSLTADSVLNLQLLDTASRTKFLPIACMFARFLFSLNLTSSTDFKALFNG
jgi:hypothetical protein